MITPRFDIPPDYLAQQGLSPSFPERFWKNVFITESHWLWEGFRRPPGMHGKIWKGAKNERGHYRGLIMAHRASWIIHKGPIPDGLWVLHCCPGKHIPFCVNPDHLYLGTDADNKRDYCEQVRLGYVTRSIEGILRGEQCPRAKLTQLEADEIWSSYTGVKNQLTDLAKRFSVSQGLIANLMLNGGWGHKGPHPAFIERQARIKAEHERPRKPMYGENAPGAKLTTEQVQEIRASYTGANGEQSALARKYGVRQGTIWYIVNHVTRVRG